MNSQKLPFKWNIFKELQINQCDIEKLNDFKQFPVLQVIESDFKWLRMTSKMNMSSKSLKISDIKWLQMNHIKLIWLQELEMISTWKT